MDSDYEFEQVAPPPPQQQETVVVEDFSTTIPIKRKPPARLPRSLIRFIHQTELLTHIAYWRKQQQLFHHDGTLKACLLSLMPHAAFEWMRLAHSADHPKTAHDRLAKVVDMLSKALPTIIATSQPFLPHQRIPSHRNVHIESSALVMVQLLELLGLKCRLVVSIQPIGLFAIKVPTTPLPSSNCEKGVFSFHESFPSHDPKAVPSVWCEVLCPFTTIWFHIDPVRSLINQPHTMEPSGKNNALSYVVGVDAHGHFKDVTRRYASRWSTSTRKKRLADGWWETVLSRYAPPPSAADAKEEEEFGIKAMHEVIPSSLQEFKSHPKYALSKLIGQRQIISKADGTPAEPIGKIKGYDIYLRQHVHNLRTEEWWLKEGYSIQPNQEPLKLCKKINATIQSKRVRNNQVMIRGEQEPMVGLFAEWQVQPFSPPPVVDSIIPKNSYGNAYLFKPWMCPHGAVHLVEDGVASVAKSLGMDYAEAVVGFEFKSGHSYPKVHGILIAEEHASTVVDRLHELNQQQSMEEVQGRRKAAFTHWKTLLHALEIKFRILNT